MSNALFEISTELEPPIAFVVGGEPYELRTMSHLNKIEEVKVRVLARREQNLAKQLDNENLAPERVSDISTKVVDCRAELLLLMTTLPKEVIAKLTTVQQRRLVDYISTDSKTLIARLLKEKAAAEKAEQEARDAHDADADAPQASGEEDDSEVGA
jgi:hypothetical protein